LIDQGVRKIDAREQVSPFYFSQGKGRVLAPAPARGMTELPLAANLGQYPQFAFNPDGTIVHNPIAPQSSFVPSFHFNSAPNIHTVRRNQVSAY
jgi:hypothetical protein